MAGTGTSRTTGAASAGGASGSSSSPSTGAFFLLGLGFCALRWRNLGLSPNRLALRCLRKWTTRASQPGMG